MHYQVIIVGAGTGGIMTAAQMLKRNPKLNIAIIDPAETHYYQPAYTLVGAGDFDFEKTKRSTASLIPKGAIWIKDYVDNVFPDKNTLTTRKSGDFSYEILVLSPGLVNNLDAIEGLREAVEKKVVCSNYIDPRETWRQLQAFKGGNAIFTMPTTPIKCGGGPQKIAYLTADYLRKNGLDKKSNIVFATPGSVIFGVKEIRETLEDVIRRYGIKFKPGYAPVKIDATKKTVTFKLVGPNENKYVVTTDNDIKEIVSGDATVEIPFDFLHLAPPQEAPAFIKTNQLLANETGWLDVDINTLQHKRFENIFGIGDAAAIPTAKTGAAVRKQVPVIVESIFNLLNGKAISEKRYEGYSSCPLVTGYGKMVLAEFDYKNNFTPDPKLKQLLIWNSDKEHYRLWLLKKYMLPHLYWNKMMKGINV